MMKFQQLLPLAAAAAKEEQVSMEASSWTS